MTGIAPVLIAATMYFMTLPARARPRPVIGRHNLYALIFRTRTGCANAYGFFFALKRWLFNDRARLQPSSLISPQSPPRYLCSWRCNG
jgi:hypothetical protein